MRARTSNLFTFSIVAINKNEYEKKKKDSILYSSNKSEIEKEYMHKGKVTIERERGVPKKGKERKSVWTRRCNSL